MIFDELNSKLVFCVGIELLGIGQNYVILDNNSYTFLKTNYLIGVSNANWNHISVVPTGFAVQNQSWIVFLDRVISNGVSIYLTLTCLPKTMER